MSRKLAIVFFVACFHSLLFAQSAEQGSAFNQYMSADAGVNLLSGTVALSKTLASISAGDAQASFSMSYSGNITQAVNNRNDVAPTGWLGLGWSMGFAKIISEHGGTMALVDDSYYLMTAEGGKHKIFEEQGRWWIENLPYWKVEPTLRSNVNYGSKNYTIIVGWTLTDDSGRKYSYGDFDDNAALQSGNVMRNATQYALAWPKTYGRVGSSIGGDAYPYPNVWNLSEIKDLKGNFLSYEYMQKGEALAVGSWKSDANGASYAKYTKECYLKTVKSSDGNKVEFILKPKGKGEFLNEYLDKTGDEERDENDADAFIDPIERHYLAGVELYAKDGTTILSKVEFCYGSLALAPKIKTEQGFVRDLKDSRYLKRILKSVIFTNGNGDVSDKEEYFYNTDEKEADPEKNIPLGMLTSVEGSNCGRIEFGYSYIKPSNADSLGLHSQKIPLKDVSSIGYLEDGTPYIVGFNNNQVSIYVRMLGTWIRSKTFSEDVFKYKKDASFMIGDKGWFVYVKPDGEKADYTPVVWNGREFEKQETIKDNGSRTNIALGAGFIFKARIDRPSDGKYSRITLSIPWSIWGQTYTKIDDFINEDGENENYFVGDDGAQDRRAIRVFATANHVGIFYLDTDGYNNGRLRIYTFNHDKSKLVKTYDEGDLDDDNKYVLNGDFLYAATEDKGPLGHNAEIYQWFEPSADHEKAKWYSVKEWDLHGVQQEPSVEAFGSNYFVVRHNDNDDMSVFYWDGEKWESKYKNRNMVSGDDFDFFYEAEWNGISGNDFFIAREPLVEKTTISIPYWIPKRWGLRKRHVKIDVWSSTYRGALLDRYDFHDGIWTNTGAQNLHDSQHKTHVMVGTDWYVEKTSKKAFTWNGLEWLERDLPENLTFGSDDNFKSLGGNSFAIKDGNQTTIYFKKSDTFDGPYGVYLVTKKTISDPVLDKVVEYDYSYQWAGNDDNKVTFDFLNNTPIIGGYTVVLPNNIGIQTKTLCKNVYTPGKLGLGAGQICSEETKSGKNNRDVTNQKTTTYERFESKDWPKRLHLDRVSEVVTIANKSKSRETYEYSPKNGQISVVKTFLGSKNVQVKEKRIDYAFEKYPTMESSNRLLEEAGVIECLGSCGYFGNINVISAKASRFKNESGYDVVSDVWSYKNAKNIGNSFPSFSYGSDIQADSRWKKNTTYSKYVNNKAVESIDELGIKSAAIYEDVADGALISSVINAGYDEVFVLSGAANKFSDEKKEHGENIKNYQYNIVPLECGNAVDLYNRKMTGKNNMNCYDTSDPTQQDKEANYGRFAKTAVFVNGQHQLKGALTPEKKKKYVFSAWVQGVAEAGKAILKIDGNRKMEWNLEGNGKWQQIEWETDLDARRYEMELAVEGNQLRAQNVLFIPSEASATVTYWDKVWEKPVVTVNDRGIGSYSKLDNSGRVVQSFGEDVSGNVVKLSETEYRISECRVNTDGIGSLKSLEINGNTVPGIKNGASSVVVLPNSADEISMKWVPSQNGDQVKYVFRQKGNKELNWKTACCSAFEGARESLDGPGPWELLIDVLPFDDVYYTIDISKSTTGWVDYGSPREIGESPVFASSDKPDVLYYLSKNSVVYSKFDGSNWKDYPSNVDVDSRVLNSISNGIQSYVLTMPVVDRDSKYMRSTTDGTYREEDRKFNNTTAAIYDGIASISGSVAALTSNGQVGVAGEMSDFYRLAVDKNSKPYVLYQKTKNEGSYSLVDDAKYQNGKKIERTGKAVSNLVVKTFDANSKIWKMVGNTLSIKDEKPVIIPDVVSDYGVKDADIIVGNDGNLYVAYIGQVTGYVADDEQETVEIIENAEIVEKTGNNKISPRFVVIKKLYPPKTIDQSVDKSVWASPSKIQDENSSEMIPDINGDFLEVYPGYGRDYMPITSAVRVKFAKGAKNLYLAVLHQLASRNDNSKKKYALSVFKASQKKETINIDEDGQSVSLKKDAYRFEPLEDDFIKTSIQNPISDEEKSALVEEKRVIAFLDDSDPFDFAVSNVSGTDVPYVMFANEQNSNKITVVKYSGSRWVSVGKPAFDDVVNSPESAELSVGSDGNPYVVFRESSTSMNASRRNRIVPRKYSSANDKDLTLNSLGNPSGTTLGSDFRQYILKYYAWVPSDYSTMSIKPELKTVDDVRSVIVENNESVVYSWENPKSRHASLPSVNVALSTGSNIISVKVYGFNGDYLTYTICVEREIIPDENFSMTGLDNVVEKISTGSGSGSGSGSGNGSGSGSGSGSDSGSGSGSDSGSGNGSDSDSSDGDNTTWVSYGEKGTRKICFNFSAFWNMIYKGVAYHGNSCLDIEFDVSDCSDANAKIITLTGPKGAKKTVKLVDGSCKKNQNDPFDSPVYTESSSSEPSYPDDPVEPVDPNNPSSSSSNGQISDNIPEEFAPLYSYDIYAKQSLIIADRVQLQGESYVCSNVSVGVNAKIYGTLNVKNNAELRNFSYAENLHIEGTVNQQDGASTGITMASSVVMPSIESVSINVGTSDLIVANNQTAVVRPGSYKRLHIFAGAKVTFEGGVYNFESFIVEPDAKITFNNESTPIQVWVQKELQFGDRAKVESIGTMGNLFVYTNAFNVYMGVTSSLEVVLAAPNAKVDVASRCVLSGKVWAREITIQPDVVVK